MSETKKEKFRFSSREEWKKALNNAPNENWIQERSIGMGKKSDYVPIAVQQALTDVFWKEFNVIDEKYFVIVNEIVCTVKIKCLPDYPYAEHEVMTGSASKPIQSDKGSIVDKFPKGKKLNAVEYNLPAVRSSAIGNALETKGNVFGRHLGRSVSSGYNMTDKKKKK